jgi:hypothetical protein
MLGTRAGDGFRRYLTRISPRVAPIRAHASEMRIVSPELEMRMCPRNSDPATTSQTDKYTCNM